jgi:hypothetical protein
MPMTTARDKAEALFKRKEAQAIEGREAWAEYKEQQRAMQERTARLRAIRLARDAGAGKKKPAARTPAGRTAGSHPFRAGATSAGGPSRDP